MGYVDIAGKVRPILPDTLRHTPDHKWLEAVRLPDMAVVHFKKDQLVELHPVDTEPKPEQEGPKDATTDPTPTVNESSPEQSQPGVQHTVPVNEAGSSTPQDGENVPTL